MARCKYCGSNQVYDFPSYFGQKEKKCAMCGRSQKDKKGRAGQSLMPTGY